MVLEQRCGSRRLRRPDDDDDDLMCDLKLLNDRANKSFCRAAKICRVAPEEVTLQLIKN